MRWRRWGHGLLMGARCYGGGGMATSGKSRLHGLSMQSGLTGWGRAGDQSGAQVGLGT